MFKEHHKKLTYLDTGTSELPHRALKACSLYTSLPFEILELALDHFVQNTNQAIRRLHDRDEDA